MTAPAGRDLPTAVVTGAARGIGERVAAELLARGYGVVLTDVSDDVAATAARLGPHALAHVLDVTDTAAVGALVADLEAAGRPPAVWVNNAGIMPTGAFLDQAPATDDRVLDVDLRAVVHATRAVLPGMLARGRGSIVQVASATGVKPMAGLAVYSGAKAAVIGFTEALRRELRGSGVHVGVVLPYLAATPMGAGITAQRGFRPVTAEQVAHAVVRAIERRRVETYVPASLGPQARLFRELPLAVRDLLDDVLDSDRIGLGGDPARRRAYLAEVRHDPR